MNSTPEIVVSSRSLSVSELEKQNERNNFHSPTCHSSLAKKTRANKIKTCRKRLSFSPNINLLVMESPVISPINREKSAINISTPTIFDFSPRAINRILQSDAQKETKESPQNLSYLNKSISIENILRSCKMEKYVGVFRKEEIDNLAVFTSLTERDLVEIGINNKNDRMIILSVLEDY